MSDAQAKPGVKSLADFDKELAAMHMRGQWQYDALLERLIGGPPPAGKPYVWKWDAVYAKLLEACDVMPESFTARRNFSFLNPGIERGGTTQTLLMGMQIVKPGEVAWAHRHTIGALRFVIEGESAIHTVVNGEPLIMEPNDLILTPNWNWHDHHNNSSRNAIWLDVLDVPLVIGLNQAFYEPFGENTQPLRQNPADNISAHGGLVRPAWERLPRQNFPFRYPWKDVAAELDRLSSLAGTPYDGLVLEYVNPVTSGPALPTMAARIQALPPGFEGKAHRQTSSAVYFVVEGEGRTVVGDEEVEWSPRDAFVVPNWVSHRHLNRSGRDRAVLFSVSDSALLEPLGLYREEPENTLRAAPAPPVPADYARPGPK
ncbi:MAG: cupin domain-containing protein [Alphaproteobacteria bacterium]